MAIPAILVSIAGYIVKDRLSAGQAAAQAAEEFDYYLKLSEAELTELSFALARAYPVYKYWQWFSILKNLRQYGGGIPNGNGTPNGQQIPNGRQDSNLLLYAAIAGALILIVGGLR